MTSNSVVALGCLPKLQTLALYETRVKPFAGGLCCLRLAAAAAVRYCTRRASGPASHVSPAYCLQWTSCWPPTQTCACKAWRPLALPRPGLIHGCLPASPNSACPLRTPLAPTRSCSGVFREQPAQIVWPLALHLYHPSLARGHFQTLPARSLHSPCLCCPATPLSFSLLLPSFPESNSCCFQRRAALDFCWPPTSVRPLALMHLAVD